VIFTHAALHYVSCVAKENENFFAKFLTGAAQKKTRTHIKNGGI